MALPLADAGLALHGKVQLSRRLLSFHRSRQRDSKAVESFGGSHRSMSELISVSMARLTAGVYLCNSACAGRGHAHKLEREHSQKPPSLQGDYRGKPSRRIGKIRRNREGARRSSVQVARSEERRV